VLVGQGGRAYFYGYWSFSKTSKNLLGTMLESSFKWLLMERQTMTHLNSGPPETLFQQDRTKQTVAIYSSEEDTTTQQEQASKLRCVNNIVRLL